MYLNDRGKPWGVSRPVMPAASRGDGLPNLPDGFDPAKGPSAIRRHRVRGAVMIRRAGLWVALGLAPAAVFGACSKASAPASGSTESAVKPTDPREALAPMRECVETVQRNDTQWDDAYDAAADQEARCAVVLMKLRHLASLTTDCRKLMDRTPSPTLAAEERAKVEGTIGELASSIEEKLKPNSKVMATCKKWAAVLTSKPVEGPPSTSVPDGRCPTHGQVIRDARNRYNGVCMYMGNCRARLSVSSRTPDPYDKTRCDTAVKVGRSPVFISALYRRNGNNWQLDTIQ